MKIPKVLVPTWTFIHRNSPQILTICGSIGVVITAISAKESGIHAYKILEEERAALSREIKRNQSGDKLEIIPEISKKEEFLLTWRCYILPVIFGSTSILCIIGANQIGLRRAAAISSAYTLTETAFREYRSKVSEIVGKNKEQKVRDEIAADAIHSNPPGRNEIIVTGKGTSLCYDSWSGRYFESDIEKIRKAVNDFNEHLLNEMYMCLNDFYDMLGLAPTENGKDMGWDINRGKLDVSYSTHLTEDGRPCIAIIYKVEPRYMY